MSGDDQQFARAVRVVVGRVGVRVREFTPPFIGMDVRKKCNSRKVPCKERCENYRQYFPAPSDHLIRHKDMIFFDIFQKCDPRFDFIQRPIVPPRGR